jgi:hypothetical protein
MADCHFGCVTNLIRKSLDLSPLVGPTCYSGPMLHLYVQSSTLINSCIVGENECIASYCT